VGVAATLVLTPFTKVGNKTVDVCDGRLVVVD
jgi:hypothetical protein